jgi:SAM-dependent methyltransferase
MKVLTQNTRPDYGIDAPGIRMGMMIISGIGIALFESDLFVPSEWIAHASKFFIVINYLGLIAFAYGAFMASYMTWGSRVGKLKTRDKLLSKAEELVRWTEVSKVIDVGCGRGLMLCGAAKLMHKGQATGYDIWSNSDQSENSPEATLINSQIEGVSVRVKIQTGDARNLPIESESVDLVMSHWVVHNIEPEEDQFQALSEMWRVLRPGGVVLLADIANVSKYKAYFENLGAQHLIFNDGGLEAKVMGLLSGGTYVPQTLVCSKSLQ